MNISEATQKLLDALHDATMPIQRETVDALAVEAPCFALPAIMRLQRHSDALDDEERRRLGVFAALCGSSPESVAQLIDKDYDLWANFYPRQQESGRPDTNDAIATFLETYGHGESEAEDDLLERLILNPQPDYASVLEKEAAANEPREVATEGNMARIDAFLANPHHIVVEPVGQIPEPAERVNAPASAPAPTDSPLSESLAKIYIHQRRYRKAFEIISNLNLNFPEKSAYFADQLRFLEKLMKIEAYKEAHKSE